jgi:hypothetical protein
VAVSYKRIALDTDSAIRSAIDERRGAGFYDWWNRLIVLVGHFLTVHDYDTVGALAKHLGTRLRPTLRAQRCLTIITVSERRSRRAVLDEAIENAIIGWNGELPARVRSGNYPVDDPPLGDLANWFRRSVEAGVERELTERAYLLSAARVEPTIADGLGHENDPNWRDSHVEGDGVRADPEGEKAPVGVDPCTTASPEPGTPFAERLRALPLKGRQRRIADLLIDDPDLTDAELARLTGMSAGSVRKSKSEIARKVERF